VSDVPTRTETAIPAESTTNQVEVIGHWLENVIDLDVVCRLVAKDATYVLLLRTENDEPWAGTSPGRQADLDNVGTIFAHWEDPDLNATAKFGSGEDVAVFGDLRNTKLPANAVTSPFALHAKVVNDTMTYCSSSRGGPHDDPLDPATPPGDR
jgi:hypothetical protein